MKLSHPKIHRHRFDLAWTTIRMATVLVSRISHLFCKTSPRRFLSRVGRAFRCDVLSRTFKSSPFWFFPFFWTLRCALGRIPTQALGFRFPMRVPIRSNLFCPSYSFPRNARGLRAGVCALNSCGDLRNEPSDALMSC